MSVNMVRLLIGDRVRLSREGRDAIGGVRATRLATVVGYPKDYPETVTVKWDEKKTRQVIHRTFLMRAKSTYPLPPKDER